MSNTGHKVLPVFGGKRRIQIETTGRGRMPGDFADGFGNSIFVYCGDGPFLRFLPRHEYDKLITAFDKLPELVEEREQWLLRDVGGSIEEVPLRGKGRFTLPKPFRDHIGLQGGEEVVLIGCVRYVELWKSEEAYEAERKRYRDRRLITGR